MDSGRYQRFACPASKIELSFIEVTRSSHLGRCRPMARGMELATLIKFVRPVQA